MSEKPYRFFVCPECDKDKEIEPKDFAAHVKDVHGITEKKGLRTLNMHVNKRPRHAFVWEWTIGGKTFYEHRG